MMKLKSLMISCLATAMMLTGCLDEPGFEPELENGIPINLEGSVSQEQTKVTAEGFEHGDALGLYAVNYENENQTPGLLKDKGNQADHVQYIFDEEAYKWTPVKKVYYKDVNTNADLYCYYPFSEPESVSAFKFEVAKDQSKPATGKGLSPYEASDFLWSKTTNVTPTESKVKVKLAHMMSGAWVILEEGTGFAEGEFNLLDKHVMVLNTVRKATIDLSTGTVTPVGSAPATGTVMCAQADGSYRAVVVPQTVPADQKWFSLTIGTQVYTYGKPGAFTYAPGKLNKFTIRISKKGNTGEFECELSEPTILDWRQDENTHEGTARQYYCVNVKEAGTLGQLIKADKKNPDKIRNLKVSGQITQADFDFMRDSMEILEAINLKEAKVVKIHFDKISHWEYDNNGTSHEVIDRPAMDVDDIIPYGAFKDKKTLYHFVFPEKITTIASHAFYQTGLAGALVVPDDVKIIGDYAFYNTNIASVTLPPQLKEIKNDSFSKCKSLSGTLSFPETIVSIGKSAFENCSFTGNLILPNSLEFIGSSSFNSSGSFCGGLRIPDKITTIGVQAFSNSHFNGTLDLNNVTTIDVNSFSTCGFQGELIIPEGVTTIPQSCFSYNSFSSIAFPSTLKEIKDDSFAVNERLSEPIVFPEGLVIIGSTTFRYCDNISEIHIPSTLQSILGQAFSNCRQLSKISCDAIEPPAVGEQAFDGVAKDNFTLEVPERSVTRYQADPEWSKFRRIAAHHDFSINRNISRALNAGITKEYILRAPANQNWKIESKPDWITVTPESGTGKTTLTVTFQEMTPADVMEFERDSVGQYDIHYTIIDKGREGKITFLLEGKDYRTTMKVQQFDYAHADGEVITLQKATQGQGVNLVFMADCYDALDISKGTYLADIQEAYQYYFDIEPYKTYKDYFNVYAIIGVSDDSGMGTVNTVKDAKFGSQYSLDGIAPDLKTCFEYAHKADALNGSPLNMGQTLIVMVENTTDYGGICYMWGDGSAIAICPKSRDAYPFDFRGIVQHEAGGHGFGKLADEYIYHNAFISDCKCNCCEHVKEFMAAKAHGWYANLELTGDMNQVGWSHLIFHPKYSNVVDVYEGGFFHTRGVFRSEPTSCMNNNIPYYSAISRQAIVERILKYAGETFTVDQFIAKDVPGMSTPTKAAFGTGSELLNAHPNKKQFAPKYMGEKPEFN